MSQAHKESIIQLYKLQAYSDKIFIIGNAIERRQSVLDQGTKKTPTKVKNRFIYTSPLDNCVYRLIDHFKLIHDLLPGAQLHIYSNLNWYILFENYRTIMNKMQETDYIQFIGIVNYEQFEKQKLEADYWYYPIDNKTLKEPFSNSAIDAMLNGSIVISSKGGSIESLIGEEWEAKGIVIKNQNPDSKEYLDEVLEYIKKFNNNPKMID